MQPLSIVILGLSITSSWGNGHATTYRGLARALAARGHRLLFLERDVPRYAANRDLPAAPYCRTALYASLDELRDVHGAAVREADLVIVGSSVPDGIAVGRWVLATASGLVAFYDLDTPVTLGRLMTGACAYLTRDLIPAYHLYLSFTGGPIPRRIEREFGSPCARAFYCAVDAEEYFPEPAAERWDLGYLGTYSPDRQPILDRLLREPASNWPAGRFVVAGPQYPAGIAWPANVERREHLPPAEHRAFYCAQRFTLNVTRRRMITAGWSPSGRLFEAAACGTPIISDWWEGLDELFNPGRDLLLADTPGDCLAYLRTLGGEATRAIGEAARWVVLARHTAAVRAAELEDHYSEARNRRAALTRASIPG